MSQLWWTVVGAVSDVAGPGVAKALLPWIVVGLLGGGCFVLYGLTRGREFLIAGCVSLLFLVPFLRS